MLLYYLGATVTDVASTVRYQILVYPIAIIIAAVGMEQLWKQWKQYTTPIYTVSILVLFIGSVFIQMLAVSPFYFSYASPLLPKEYLLNPKDMGDGSYQAAQWLNKLPNARDTTILTDKAGVCAFFVGKCEKGMNSYDRTRNLPEVDYYVVSAGREASVTRVIQERRAYDPKNLVEYDRLYRVEQPDKYIKLGNRREDYIKIIRADSIDLIYEQQNPASTTK
jgi:hypothetical protein